jgi:hypothetical protein
MLSRVTLQSNAELILNAALMHVVVSTWSFNFRELYPDLNKDLAEFRQHLVDSMGDMAPLKVWQLQGNFNLLSLLNLYPLK